MTYGLYAVPAWISLAASFLICKVLKDTLRLGRLREDVDQWRKRRELARRIESIPEFSLPMLGRSVIVNTNHVRTATPTFLFVNSGTTEFEVSTDELRLAVAACIRSPGTLYVVCSAGEDECERLRSETLHGLGDLRILVDQDGRVSSLFHVQDTPTAVVFDSAGRFVKTGIVV